MTLEARRLAERSEQARRLTDRHLRVLAAIVMTFGVAVVAFVVFDRLALIFPATAVAFVAVEAAGRWRRRAGEETVVGVEEWYVRNGPPCVCGCARSVHQGISSGFRGQGFWSYSFFDGVCSNPACPGCTDGYRPGNGQPYKDLFPPEHVYRTAR